MASSAPAARRGSSGPTIRIASRGRGSATVGRGARSPSPTRRSSSWRRWPPHARPAPAASRWSPQLETGSLGRLADEWLKAVGGRARLAYEAFAHEDLRAANRAVFGVDAIPHHAFEDAKTILSLGADFLETWISPTEYASAVRRVHDLRDGHAARVIHVEPRYSMTAAQRRRVDRERAGCRGGDRPRLAAARSRIAPGPVPPGEGDRDPGRARPARWTWRRWPGRAACPRPSFGTWPRPS